MYDPSENDDAKEYFQPNDFLTHMESVRRDFNSRFCKSRKDPLSDWLNQCCRGLKAGNFTGGVCGENEKHIVLAFCDAHTTERMREFAMSIGGGHCFMFLINHCFTNHRSVWNPFYGKLVTEVTVEDILGVLERIEQGGLDELTRILTQEVSQ